jgi:predicted HTH transcriptional regulator
VTVRVLPWRIASETNIAFDLDYKRDHYGRTDTDRRKLAGDVAALANTAGGVILIGLEEGDQACAIGAPRVELADAEVARMRQFVAS